MVRNALRAKLVHAPRSKALVVRSRRRVLYEQSTVSKMTRGNRCCSMPDPDELPEERVLFPNPLTSRRIHSQTKHASVKK